MRYGLWNGSSDDVLDRLRRGLADLAVIAAPYDSEHLEGIPVGQEPWVTMIPKDHPLAKQPGNELPLKSLVGLSPHRAQPEVKGGGHPRVVRGDLGGAGYPV